MNICPERIEKMLCFFDEEFRYLQTVNVEYPRAEGVFKIGKTAYTKEDVKHVTALEIQLCFNQLCYAAFGEWMTEGKTGYTMQFENFLELMKENMFVLDAHLRFRKLIPKEETLTGKIEVAHTRKINELYLAHITCGIEGKFRGHVEFGLKLPQE